MEVVDTYKKMSLEKAITKKVICDLFLVSDLLEKVWVCVQGQGKESCEGCHNYVPCDLEQSPLKKK